MCQNCCFLLKKCENFGFLSQNCQNFGFQSQNFGVSGLYYYIFQIIDKKIMALITKPHLILFIEYIFIFFRFSCRSRRHSGRDLRESQRSDSRAIRTDHLGPCQRKVIKVQQFNIWNSNDDLLLLLLSRKNQSNKLDWLIAIGKISLCECCL